MNKRIKQIKKGISVLVNAFSKTIDVIKAKVNVFGKVLIFTSVPLGYSILVEQIQSNKHLNVILATTISYVLIVTGLYLMHKGDKWGNGDKVPRPEKRLTKYDNGYVEIKESDIDKALLYLNDLENWLENN